MQKHLSLKHGVLTLLLMLGSCVGLYAQQEQRVTLNLKNVSLKEMFRAIEEQSTYRFSYRNNVVDDRADITVSKKNVAVSTVLTDVLPARGLDYEIVSPKSIVVFQRRASTGKRGEKKTVKGVVKDEQGIPVIGASVKESGTSNGTVTDLDGNFSLSVAEDAILDVTYIGYAAQHVNTSGKSVLDIQMAEDAEQLQEVVVTGYMAEKKASLTGSVAVIDMKDVADIPTGNVLTTLQGRVAGMNITTDGRPGGSNVDVKLRGTTTINNSAPLYVIDGVPTHDNMSTILSSNDVESIQVLKDAASAAIYGAQAANGVIIITTKRAQEGVIKVDFDMSLSLQTFSTGLDLLDANQWGQVYWQAYKNTYGTHPNSVVYGNGETPELQPFYYDEDGIRIRTGNTDWAKEIYHNAWMQNYNLSLSRGFKDGSVALTMNYMNQDGLVRSSDYERFNTRLTSSFHFLDNKIRVGESISVNRWKEHLHPGGIEENVVAQHPAIPVYDEEGGYAGGYVDVLGDRPNLIRLTDNEANNRHTNWRIFGNAYLEVEPVKRLIFRSNFGVNYLTGFNSVYVPKWREGSRSVNINELTVRQDNSMQWIWSNTLNYSLDFGKNSLVALAGMEAKKEYGEHVQGYGQGLVIDDLDYRYLDVVTSAKNVGNNSSTYAMISYFGKVNYAWDNKYLISGTLRRDASSRFGQNNKAAVFPSVSAGWRISAEPFMQKTSSWLDDLKLRVSWGVNGNDQIDNTATYSKYISDLNTGSYNLSGDGFTLLPGAVRTMSANPDLRWEQTEQLNFGLDASFLNGRLLWTFDYYDKETTDMLIRKDYIAVIGEGGYYFYNGARLTNRGVETTLTWRDRIRDFHYDVTFNMSYYKNRVADLPTDIYYTYGGGNGIDKSIVGQPLGSWMSYRTDGVFRTQEEVDEYLSKYDVQIGKPGVGRLRYVDLDHNGIINANDRDWAGTDQPKVIAGLNLSASWKGFDLSMFFNGMIRDVWNNSKTYTDFFQLTSTGNHSTRLLKAMEAWNRYETTGVYDCGIPALTVLNDNSEDRSSNYFIEDGSYIKLKTLTLGYSLPESVTRKMSLSRARVFFQAQNLFTLTRYLGADPEGLGYTYPLPRTFTFGLSLGI